MTESCCSSLPERACLPRHRRHEHHRRVSEPPSASRSDPGRNCEKFSSRMRRHCVAGGAEFIVPQTCRETGLDMHRTAHFIRRAHCCAQRFNGNLIGKPDEAPASLFPRVHWQNLERRLDHRRQGSPAAGNRPHQIVPRDVLEHTSARAKNLTAAAYRMHTQQVIATAALKRSRRAPAKSVENTPPIVDSPLPAPSVGPRSTGSKASIWPC